MIHQHISIPHFIIFSAAILWNILGLHRNITSNPAKSFLNKPISEAKKGCYKV
ncbi:hypothetical protein GYO_0792 [Bacillus spizizenii TU-B-10]|uniref:Uncharacterized protein n=1 Tax=Bacillus spizizenii (strain DSM 15029 / JCM 12233 / NBRC 101239 / NRRL B-23049 / TU-B-10) TaxID=1052585 RepID=G4NR20_BACS4|nr:hypothetical protein GYO_0792 [Bacillus spizizenii TU-B-10]